MSTTFLALTIGGVLVAGLLLAHYLRRRDSGGYRRRFDNPATRDEAFPVASTLYVGDGGGVSHSHHQHSADCAHTTDGGGGCSD